MEKYLKADRIIRTLIQEGRTEFAIYPFGEFGMLVKDILNKRYGITEKYIIDNKLGKYSLNKTIITLDEFVLNKENNITILLSSDGAGYTEVRYELLKRVDISKVIDVFSYSMYFDKNVYYDLANYEHPRVSALESAAREIYRNNVVGAVAECGVYKGEFSNHISRLFPDRKLYLFDTFSGFDARDITEQEEMDSGEFRRLTKDDDATAEVVLERIGYRANAIIKEGYFPETARGLEDERFAFVSLDTDLYKPIKAGLEFFYPRMAPGGYIFVDDFRHPKLLGVRKAVMEFCQREKIGYVSLPDGNDATAIIVKPLS